MKRTRVQKYNDFDLKLQKTRYRYDVRKYCFTNRVVNIWNSLPNWIISADATNTFKTDLITFGRIRKLYMTFELNWKEPEVVVKYRI